MRHYEHSGAVPLSGLLLTAIVALAMSVTGVIYTFLVVWIPFIYINLFITIGFGALVGLAIGYAARLGKIRNTLVVGALGVLGALPAYYAAWMFDPLARIGFDEGVFIVDPWGIYGWIRVLYDNGSWGIFGIDTVKGLALAAVWVIEAGIVFVASGACAAMIVADHPFCETCRRWTNKHEDLRRLSLVDLQTGVLEQLADGRFDILREVPLADSSEEHFLRLDLSYCPTCGDCNVFSIQMADTVVDKDGNSTTETLALIDKLMVTADEVTLIRSAGRPRTQEELKRRDVDVPDDDSEGDAPGEASDAG